jgi:hypothetical protein
MANTSIDAAFRVSGFDHFLSGLIANHPRFWIGLGNMETKALADEIAPIAIEAPVYITGLARAGTTIALEILAAHPDVATHLYRDFPPVFTPYWWNWFVEKSRKAPPEPQERAHKDGIMITPDSPEAREEVIWMAFFEALHDPAQSNVLDSRTDNPAFEAFYRDHIRKLLAARGRKRYLSKGNYNVTRIAYLHKLFPDARFVIPVRDPVWHIASLMKQHRLFREGERGNDRALEYMRRVGHFEFGLDLRPINCGDSEKVREIQALWEAGEDVRGWARYWAMVYGYVADRLDHDPVLSEAAMVLRYEDLCDRPTEIMEAMLAHCGMSVADEIITRFAGRLNPPDYYSPDFSDAELRAIAEETGGVSGTFSYSA